jgi:hypothetical protein
MIKVFFAAVSIAIAAGSAHAQTFERGSVSTPMANKTVWQSSCSSGTRAISGACTFSDGAGASPDAVLKRFGPSILLDGSQGWICEWTKPVEAANVQAWCAKISGG